jgi:tetratricopeptide (TPR) repeat protein
VRQYALEKLGESGEADAIRSGHRDHYTALAALLDTPASGDHEQRLEQAEMEIDNLRAGFEWSRESSEIDLALQLASSLLPLWQARGRIREGLAWFDAVLANLDAQHLEVAPALRARVFSDVALLRVHLGGVDTLDRAQQALAIARELDEPGLLARALAACGFIADQGYDAEAARGYFAEAAVLARALDDRWRLSRILALQAMGANTSGDPSSIRAAAEEGRDLADAIGDRFNSRVCRFNLAAAQLMSGDLAAALAQYADVAAEAKSAHDEVWSVLSLGGQSFVLALRDDAATARAMAEAALQRGATSSTRLSWPVQRRHCCGTGLPSPRWRTRISPRPAPAPMRRSWRRPAGTE